MAVAKLSTTKLKKALTEALEENPRLLREALSDILEDIGLAEAMRRAEKSGTVSRAEIMKALRKGR